jgi:hypothetical protein
MASLRGVELARVGTWDAHTGDGKPWQVTSEILRSAVDAAAAGVAVPVLRLGHTDPRFDGEPAAGVVTNLRLSDDGTVLLGDFEGVAPDLAASMSTRYPSRSVEGLTNYRDTQVRAWPLVLEAVALLGTTAPAVKELAPVPVAASRRVSIPTPTRPRTLVAATQRHRAQAVAVAAARRRRTHRTIELRG